MNKSLLLLLAFAPLCAQKTCADVKMPALFGDHMMLQQEATIPVWGLADPGEKITVTFGDKKADTTAGADGKWRADLPALPAGTPPGTLTIAGKNTITINDVLVGDVWICSGQSNMEYQMNNPQTADATDGQIRLFHVAHQLGLLPLDDVKGEWQVCSPDTLPGFTAVGYFFAKNLRAVIKRPIGLIEASVGATPAQAWTDLPTLEGNPLLQHYADSYKTVVAGFPGGQSEMESKIAAFAIADKEWNDKVNADTAYQAALKAWPDAVAQAKAAGKPQPPRPQPPVPRPVNPGDAHTAVLLFNGMINPLIPYAFKGAIWYQGENNAGLVTGLEYSTLFPAMITDWRSKWKQGDFPFLFVQLANYGFPQKTPNEMSAWALVRESQLKTLSLPKTGMAVAIDIGTGDNIHPPDKTDVGARLSLAARHIAYGENLVYTGPIYDSSKVEDGKIRIRFKTGSTGGGLTIGAAPWVDPKAAPISKTDLQGFAIAGEDKNFVWADAKIDGNEVVVSGSQVPNPVAVRYEWASDPVGNLYNKEGLPASPFRTDEWNPPPPAKPAPRAATPAASVAPVPAK